MNHPCACCRLRFTNQSELADHVRNDHADRTPVPERRETIHASRVWPAPRRTTRLP
jgi:hypothetical protein